MVTASTEAENLAGTALYKVESANLIILLEQQSLISPRTLLALHSNISYAPLNSFSCSSTYRLLIPECYR